MSSYDNRVGVREESVGIRHGHPGPVVRQGFRVARELFAPLPPSSSFPQLVQ